MRAILMVAAMAFAATALAGSDTCPMDKSQVYKTGKSITDKVTGKLLWEYKCGMGHTFWSP